MRCPTYTPAPYGVLLMLRHGSPALPCPGTPGAAKGPAPLCTSQSGRARRALVEHVSRYDPSCIALTGSCARPPPSRCLSRPRGQGGWAGCGPPQRGAGPSRRARCVSVPACVPPTPVALEVLFPVSSLTTSPFPSCEPGRRLPHVRAATSARRPLRGCSPALRCRPAGMRTTPVAPPVRLPPQGRRGLYVRASRGSFPPHAPDRLAVRTGPLTAEDFHLIRYAALSAVPRTLALTCCQKRERRRSGRWRQSGAAP
jgi:hypothetical protein